MLPLSAMAYAALLCKLLCQLLIRQAVAQERGAALQHMQQLPARRFAQHRAGRDHELGDLLRQ